MRLTSVDDLPKSSDSDYIPIGFEKVIHFRLLHRQSAVIDSTGYLEHYDIRRTRWTLLGLSICIRCAYSYSLQGTPYCFLSCDFASRQTTRSCNFILVSHHLFYSLYKSCASLHQPKTLAHSGHCFWMIGRVTGRKLQNVQISVWRFRQVSITIEHPLMTLQDDR